MNPAMRDCFLKLIPESNRNAYIDGHLTANPKMTFRQVFDYFWEQFGIATEEDIVDNVATLLNPWQPNEGLEVLIDGFDKAQVYAFFAKSQMDDKTLINPFLILIKKTGKYVRAYKDWIAKRDADKTYVNLKEFWRKEHLKMKRTNPSASTYGYGMNATAESTTDQPDMATIFEQCANAMMNSQWEMQERQQQFEANMTANIMNLQNPVSYTHLTLPTILLV